MLMAQTIIGEIGMSELRNQHGPARFPDAKVLRARLPNTISSRSLKFMPSGLPPNLPRSYK